MRANHQGVVELGRQGGPGGINSGDPNGPGSRPQTANSYFRRSGKVQDNIQVLHKTKGGPVSANSNPGVNHVSTTLIGGPNIINDDHELLLSKGSKMYHEISSSSHDYNGSHNHSVSRSGGPGSRPMSGVSTQGAGTRPVSGRPQSGNLMATHWTSKRLQMYPEGMGQSRFELENKQTKVSQLNQIEIVSGPPPGNSTGNKIRTGGVSKNKNLAGLHNNPQSSKNTVANNPPGGPGPQSPKFGTQQQQSLLSHNSNSAQMRPVSGGSATKPSPGQVIAPPISQLQHNPFRDSSNSPPGPVVSSHPVPHPILLHSKASPNSSPRGAGDPLRVNGGLTSGRIIQKPISQFSDQSLIPYEMLGMETTILEPEGCWQGQSKNNGKDGGVGAKEQQQRDKQLQERRDQMLGKTSDDNQTSDHDRFLLQLDATIASVNEKDLMLKERANEKNKLVRLEYQNPKSIIDPAAENASGSLYDYPYNRVRGSSSRSGIFGQQHGPPGSTVGALSGCAAQSYESLRHGPPVPPLMLKFDPRAELPQNHWRRDMLREKEQKEKQQKFEFKAADDYINSLEDAAECAGGGGGSGQITSIVDNHIGKKSKFKQVPGPSESDEKVKQSPMKGMRRPLSATPTPQNFGFRHRPTSSKKGVVVFQDGPVDLYGHHITQFDDLNIPNLKPLCIGDQLYIDAVKQQDREYKKKEESLRHRRDCLLEKMKNGGRQQQGEVTNHIGNLYPQFNYHYDRIEEAEKNLGIDCNSGKLLNRPRTAMPIANTSKSQQQNSLNQWDNYSTVLKEIPHRPATAASVPGGGQTVTSPRKKFNNREAQMQFQRQQQQQQQLQQQADSQSGLFVPHGVQAQQTHQQATQQLQTQQQHINKPQLYEDEYDSDGDDFNLSQYNLHKKLDEIAKIAGSRPVTPSTKAIERREREKEKRKQEKENLAWTIGRMAAPDMNQQSDSDSEAALQQQWAQAEDRDLGIVNDDINNNYDISQNLNYQYNYSPGPFTRPPSSTRPQSGGPTRPQRNLKSAQDTVLQWTTSQSAHVTPGKNLRPGTGQNSNQNIIGKHGQQQSQTQYNSQNGTGLSDNLKKTYNSNTVLTVTTVTTPKLPSVNRKGTAQRFAVYSDEAEQSRGDAENDIIDFENRLKLFAENWKG